MTNNDAINPVETPDITEDTWSRYLSTGLEEELLDKRNRVIGNLRTRHNMLSWSPAGSKTWFSLPIAEFTALMVEHCASQDRQRAHDEDFHEHAILRPEHELSAEQLTPEQHQHLLCLNERLAKIEEAVLKEALPQLAALDARVNDPDDWLHDYEYECKFRFSLREDDPDYDGENSENVLVTLKEDIKCDVSDAHFIASIYNHNEFVHWEGHPMQAEHHCWLYHCLYDHTNLGWINMLRIGEVWIDVNIRLQRWEYGLEH